MYNLLPILSTILPIIASSLLILVLSINLYLKIRRKFPISVNCWFCNSWTKVAYDDRNSFDCPTCSQYNGFTKDGGYNKVIPEQHDELMNKSSRIQRDKTLVANGLCILCNNNQNLKIFQLANFVPLIEENYDIEIEHFQKQLEKAYKLCKKCDRVLKKTIEKQNAWIFGNRVKNMCTNGISKVTDQIKKKTRLSILVKTDQFLFFFLVCSVIFITAFSMKHLTKNLAVYVPTSYLHIYKSAISASNASINFVFFSKNIKIDAYTAISALGLFLQIFRSFWGLQSANIKLNQLLCWVILVLTSHLRLNKNYSNFIVLVEIFCCVYLLGTIFTKCQDQKTAQKPQGKAIRKMVKNLEYTCTDFSDASDFEENSSSSSKNASTLDTSTSSKKSFSPVNNVPQNQTFTANSVLNSSFIPTSHDIDLNKSLNNLNLGRSSILKRPKPVLSPPKFQTVNSWVAGGFWKNADNFIMPIAQRTNLSRSSSESSGFGSQHNEVFTQPKSYFGEFDRGSMNSDFIRVSPSPPNLIQGDFRRNIFYPNLGNNMLVIQRMASPGPNFQRFENWSDKINAQATQSFRDLSLQSNY